MGIIAVPNPNHGGGSAVARSFQTGRMIHADPSSVARVRPRTSKGITDLLLLSFMRLKAVYTSKKKRWGTRSEGRKGEREPPAALQSRPRSTTTRPPPRFPTTTSLHSDLSARIEKTPHLFSKIESRSLSELTRQIAPPTKNGHAPPPTESRKNSQSVNPSSVRAW